MLDLIQTNSRQFLDKGTGFAAAIVGMLPNQPDIGTE
jgi:hypothetical protein